VTADSPSHRVLIARIAAHGRWSTVSDRTAATAAARQAASDRFGKLVDPDGVLSPDERARRADAARTAHMLKMSLRSAQARKTRRVAGGA
jgi:hypothetical protein